MKWLVLFGLILVSGAAHAGNGVSSVSVTKYRNLTSVAISAIVTGDDDSSAVLRLFHRYSGSFDTGMVMVRRPHGPVRGTASDPSAGAAGEIFEGRILNMTAGQTAEFYIEHVDATSGTGTTSTDTVSCAQVRPIVATGPVFYVSKSGLDSNPGSLSQPVLTINKALDLLEASTNSGQNGGVFVQPGHYHERIDLDWGTDGFQRFLSGDGTSPDSTIICGANELVEQGYTHESAPGVGVAISWAFTGHDSTYAAYFPPGDSVQLVVLGWAEMLHRKTSIKAMLDDSTYAYVFASPNGIGSGELSGWWWQNDTLYVKRRNGQSPAGQVLHVGYRDKLIAVKKRNWRISRLTLRYAGSLTNDPDHPANVNPGMNGLGVSAGLNGNGSGLVLDSLRFIGLNSSAVNMNLGAGGIRCDSAVIRRCSTDGLTVGGMYYGAAKSRPEENANQIVVRGFMESITTNTLTGTFNGIGGGTTLADSLCLTRSEITSNTLTNMVDDAIEADDSHAINLLIRSNTTRNTGSGLSACASLTGPVLVFYNTFTNFERGVKACGGNTAIVKLYHNTFASSRVPSTGFDGAPGGSIVGFESINNIWTGHTVAAPIIGPNQATSSTTNTFNWDLVSGLVLTAPVVTWRLAGSYTNYTLATAQSGLGWLTNGKYNSKAYFADSTNYDYRVSKTSPAYQKGRRITGVNTTINGLLYTTLPTMGSQGCFCP